MSMIRTAHPGDTAALVSMIHRFLEASPYGQLLAFNPDALVALGLALLSTESGTILVAEDGDHLVGMIAGFVGTHPATAEIWAEELAWWVDEDARSGSAGPKLLRSFEAWAQQNGAVGVKMVAPVESKVLGFYERLGYTPLETVVVKRF